MDLLSKPIQMGVQKCFYNDSVGYIIIMQNQHVIDKGGIDLGSTVITCCSCAVGSAWMINGGN